MTRVFGGPQLLYLIVAMAVLALAFAGIVWVGRMIRGELGPGAARGGDPAGLAMLEQVPPSMMKEAIARGLVVPSQLAAMTPLERTFLFASLKQKLAATVPESAHALEVHPQEAPKSAPTALPVQLPPAVVPNLDTGTLRAWCPMCGAELRLPAFPPLTARCAACGMKSAIRAEDGGRYVVTVSPPPRLP